MPDEVCTGVAKEIFLAVKRLDAADKRWRETLEGLSMKPYRFWVDLYEGLKAGTVAPSDAVKVIEGRGEVSDAEMTLYGFLTTWLKRCPTSRIK